MRPYYEFFAGGGLVRAGLGNDWECVFANDISLQKGTTYCANWSGQCLQIGDVADTTTADLPGRAALAWASFPCQDLSLAGGGAGLAGERSGTFWPFWKLIRQLRAERRQPRLVVLENVCGTLSSHGGRDFSALASAIAREKYRFGAVVIDALRFVPQSRPRLFIICVQDGTTLPARLVSPGPNPTWHPPHLTGAFRKLSPRSKISWAWWHLPVPHQRNNTFSDLIEDEPRGVAWHTPEETRYLLSLMSPLNRKKVELAKRMRRKIVGAVYKRTRKDTSGRRSQRAEVRFDDISGCLRTPVGGSSRQSIIVVEGPTVRSRLLSPREAARLMGLPESYKLPSKYNEAYHIAGDGVVVPVVRFLAAHILEPLLEAAENHNQEAA
jgi:DNA (cytosine-5)-methyltransferase 1